MPMLMKRVRACERGNVWPAVFEMEHVARPIYDSVYLHTSKLSGVLKSLLSCSPRPREADQSRTPCSKTPCLITASRSPRTPRLFFLPRVIPHLPLQLINNATPLHLLIPWWRLIGWLEALLLLSPWTDQRTGSLRTRRCRNNRSSHTHPSIHRWAGQRIRHPRMCPTLFIRREIFQVHVVHVHASFPICSALPCYIDSLP
jgi:hypothetical protein